MLVGKWNDLGNTTSLQSKASEVGFKQFLKLPADKVEMQHQESQSVKLAWEFVLWPLNPVP